MHTESLEMDKCVRMRSFYASADLTHKHTTVLSNIASKDFSAEWKQRTFSKFELPENVQVYIYICMHGVLVNIFRHTRRISPRTKRN